eukprot:356868-Chlamydomonas_euryale.AAC.15
MLKPCTWHSIHMCARVHQAVLAHICIHRHSHGAAVCLLECTAAIFRTQHWHLEACDADTLLKGVTFQHEQVHAMLQQEYKDSRVAVYHAGGGTRCQYIHCKVRECWTVNKTAQTWPNCRRNSATSCCRRTLPTSAALQSAAPLSSGTLADAEVALSSRSCSCAGLMLVRSCACKLDGGP